MTEPPAIVFVTAFDEHAAAAYGVGAVDYLLKPVSAERLAAALDRVRRFAAPDAGPGRPPVDALAAVPVELGGRTRFVRRDDVRFAEAQGDYVRLHTPDGSAPAAHPDLPARGALAPAPGSSGCTAATCWRCARCASCAATSAAGCSRTPTSATCRSAAGTPASCASGCSTPPPAASSRAPAGRPMNRAAVTGRPEPAAGGSR